jgi:hypothetical protein
MEWGYAECMRLLILGGLGPYPERLETFVERGHQVWYACTQYLPAICDSIPSITALSVRADDESLERLLRLVRDERIEVIYSLLNAWDGSNAATAALLRRGCPIPVVRHYKEHHLAPHEDERVCLEQSAGVIFLNEASRDYFAEVYRRPARSTCLDGDLIPRRYLAGELRPKHSAADQRPHLLIAGTFTDDEGRYDYRGLLRALADHGAWVHLYGKYSRMQAEGWMREEAAVEVAYRALAAEHPSVRLHEPIPPARFVEEWSAYDAGLLHVPEARDRFRALNYPNRHAAYLAAGLPVALQAGEMPAMERRLAEVGVAVLYREAADLVDRLPDAATTVAARTAREQFTWEAVFPALEGFIASCAG